MKKNDYLLLTATLAYSLLFFKQNAGINFLLFNSILILLLAFRNKKLLHEKKWLWAAGLCILSSVCVFLNSSTLALTANIVSLLLISAFSFNVVTSSVFSFLFSCFSVVTSVAFIIVDSLKRFEPGSTSQPVVKSYRSLSVAAVLIISLLFLNMYRSSNPLFAENTRWINLDFISIEWIFFTMLGFILMYGVMYQRTVGDIEQWENNLPLSTHDPVLTPHSERRFEAERFAGALLFCVLNLMLLILNFGDIQTLYFNGGLPKNISHSDFVHSGVGIIILSILVATALIMYLFRATFMSVKHNKLLLLGVYAWIGQNLLMLSSTFIRNQIYVEQYNLTYKRIGVYVWLLLAAIGLCVLFWKVYQNRSNWYLVRTNFALWFSVLSFSAIINWDKRITQFNIHNKVITEVDFNYLFSLSDAAIPDLVEVCKRPDFKLIDHKNKEFRAYVSDQYYRESFRFLLQKKIHHYIDEYKNSWQSYDLRDREITNSLK